MTFAGNPLHVAARLLPVKLRDWLRWKYQTWHHRALLAEMKKVPIAESGMHEDKGWRTPFVRLEDGTLLYGRAPSEFERELFKRWRRLIPPQITDDTIGVASDVILRYLYPHAMPQLTLPYPRSARRCFHPQHVETVEDLPKLSRMEKDRLKTLYSVKPGEFILDVGAYLGYGAVRLSKEVGPDGRIVAVETDADSARLLRMNVEENNLGNVKVIQKAVWNRAGEEISLSRAGDQANSLVDGIVNPNNKVKVQTTTLDTVVKETKMERVDMVSVTINGAEVEAVDGMRNTLRRNSPIRLSIAGWYKRDGHRICDVVSSILRSHGLRVAVGHDGGVLSWK